MGNAGKCQKPEFRNLIRFVSTGKSEPGLKLCGYRLILVSLLKDVKRLLKDVKRNEDVVI